MFVISVVCPKTFTRESPLVQDTTIRRVPITKILSTPPHRISVPGRPSVRSAADVVSLQKSTADEYRVDYLVITLYRVLVVFVLRTWKNRIIYGVRVRTPYRRARFMRYKNSQRCSMMCDSLTSIVPGRYFVPYIIHISTHAHVLYTHLY